MPRGTPASPPPLGLLPRAVPQQPPPPRPPACSRGKEARAASLQGGSSRQPPAATSPKGWVKAGASASSVRVRGVTGPRGPGGTQVHKVALSQSVAPLPSVLLSQGSAHTRLCAHPFPRALARGGRLNVGVSKHGGPLVTRDCPLPSTPDPRGLPQQEVASGDPSRIPTAGSGALRPLRLPTAGSGTPRSPRLPTAGSGAPRPSGNSGLS